MTDERKAYTAKPNDPTATPSPATVEVRSFDPKARSEAAPGLASRDAPVSTQEGRLGPGGDPVEGKP